MISDQMISRIRCPVTGEPLQHASPHLLSSVLQQKMDGQLFDQLGVQVEEEFDNGLVNESNSCFIMIRHGIPVLLPDSTIPIDHLEFPEPN